jgi:hypothetical protein
MSIAIDLDSMNAPRQRAMNARHEPALDSAIGHAWMPGRQRARVDASSAAARATNRLENVRS